MTGIEDRTIEEVWELIDEQLQVEKEPYADINAIYEFQLTDEPKISYQLHLQDGVANVYNTNKEKADCVLIMKTKYFKRLLLGKLNSTTAFMTGRISVKGNITLALKLESMLKKYQFE